MWDFWKRGNGRTDGHTDGRTDRPSYRDARKMSGRSFDDDDRGDVEDAVEKYGREEIEIYI